MGPATWDVRPRTCDVTLMEHLLYTRRQPALVVPSGFFDRVFSAKFHKWLIAWEFVGTLSNVPPNSSNGCPPASRLAVDGGFLRSIRPLMVVRFLTASLGVALCVLPATASAADAAQKPGQARRTTSTVKKKHAYSATASRSRRATLARARASARAREQVRLRSLHEAMTPRFKTDATGASRPRRPRCRRHHLQPGHRPGPLRRELPGQAIDCQHHQGDDRARVPRRQPRPQRRRSRSSAATSTPPRRPISRPTTSITGDRAAAPAADRRPTTAPRARSRARRMAARRSSSSG